MRAMPASSTKPKWLASSPVLRVRWAGVQDYLFKTVAALRSLGIHDARLEALQKQVEAAIEAA